IEPTPSSVVRMLVDLVQLYGHAFEEVLRSEVVQPSFSFGSCQHCFDRQVDGSPLGILQCHQGALRVLRIRKVGNTNHPGHRVCHLSFPILLIWVTSIWVTFHSYCRGWHPIGPWSCSG